MIGRDKHLVGPVLAVVLVTGVTLTSRWMSDGRTDTGVRSKKGPSGVQTKSRREPVAYRFLYPGEPGTVAGKLTFAQIVGGQVAPDAAWCFGNLDEWCDWAPEFFADRRDWTPRFQPGWLISRRLEESADCTCARLFWCIQALRFFDPENLADQIDWIEVSGKNLTVRITHERSHYDADRDTLYWNPVATEYPPDDPNLVRECYKTIPLITLAYTLSHAYYDLCCDADQGDPCTREQSALATENRIRGILLLKDPACSSSTDPSRELLSR